MSEHTAISWCDSTFNPWIGCTKVSPACDHCYAERLMDHRMHRVRWGAGQARAHTGESTWQTPRYWNSRHDAFERTYGRRRRVFCASLADVFDNEVPPAWRAELFELIYATPNLDWLLLTKRIGNAASMLVGPGMPGRMPSHARLGITICNQPEADRDIRKLLALRGPNFLSIEPMLGPVDVFSRCTGELLHTSGDDCNPGHIDWVICGGESGPQARPMNPDWPRSLRDQCSAAGVPFHFKQWGEWAPRPVGRVHDSYRWPIHPGEPAGGIWSYRITGAGRWLDGIEHNGAPA